MFGVGDAALYCSVLATLIHLYPKKAATMVSSSEAFFGLGYTIGKRKALYHFDKFGKPH